MVNVIFKSLQVRTNPGHVRFFFRNYMEHVADHIKDWTAEEEEKYQAELRRKELEAMRAAAATPSPTVSRPSSGKSRARSGSPKKSRSKSPKGLICFISQTIRSVHCK